MSTLLASDVVALAVADLHLSLHAPMARSAEPNWCLATSRAVTQLRALQDKYKVPVICAGDIFHVWCSLPELTNFAIRELPFLQAVPGQHDLPYHDYSQREKSAYETLRLSKRLETLHPGGCTAVGRVRLHGFPWGFPPTPYTGPKVRGLLDVAVVHAYCWHEGYGFPGAPDFGRVTAFRTALKGYDVAIFGDNHRGFSLHVGECFVYNCGGFMRRNSDEKEAQPAVGVILRDGSVVRHRLDCSADLFLPAALETVQVAGGFKIQDFVRELEALQQTALDFPSAVEAYFRKYKVSAAAKKIILTALQTT